RGAGRDAQGVLLLADAARLPLRDAALDAVFASGLVAHLPEPAAGLRELARVVRAGGRLALFHPIGRAALAARQGRELTPDDLRAEHNLRPLLAGSGWELVSYEDLDSSFLAVAVRRLQRTYDGPGRGARGGARDHAGGWAPAPLARRWCGTGQPPEPGSGNVPSSPTS
ncbi:class I SAM-dependent methyltransferase, partial [Streptomyces toxytricini]|uniref:class I SAM-dependent methyltransferase n=1 Tax=Streptomyces toxytricini TaxID=67369 RepID=UPI0034163130